VALLTADDQHRPHVVDHFAHVDHALTATSFVRCNQQVDLAPVQRRPGRRYSLAWSRSYRCRVSIVPAATARIGG
jgi:hypothetical protein